jgi:hypothetical protein
MTMLIGFFLYNVMVKKDFSHKVNDLIFNITSSG